MLPGGTGSIFHWGLPPGEPQDVVYKVQALKNKGCVTADDPKKA